jgi:hypothetical protein
MLVQRRQSKWAEDRLPPTEAATAAWDSQHRLFAEKEALQVGVPVVLASRGDDSCSLGLHDEV